MKPLFITWMLLACAPPQAQERLARPEALKYAFFLALDLRQLLGTPIPTDPDLKRPVAVRLGAHGALVLPESKLTRETLSKTSTEPVAIGQLWLVGVTPVVGGEAVPSSKLRLVEVSAEAGQVTAACCALAVRKNAAERLELLIYGKTRDALSKVPLEAAADRTDPESPVDLSAARTGDRGEITLKLLGKYQARFPVGEAEF